MSQAYYNEFDKEKGEWIRELIKAGLVAPGDVDERSITDVQPDDLRGYKQCHFFAGIAVWSYSLRLAGWDDDRECWTGSCPCPSFSCAGKGQGFDDPRHLWPAWIRLIRERKPPVIFGEQSDDAIGYGWLDLVQTDLEAEAYAVGKAVLCSAGVGGSDIRQRLYWLAHHENIGRERSRETRRRGNGLANHGTDGGESGEGRIQRGGKHGQLTEDGGSSIAYPTADALKGYWRDADWLLCTDGRWRPVEPGTFPLVNGAPGRLGRLRGYGDAINAEVAKAFIESYMEVESIGGR